VSLGRFQNCNPLELDHFRRPAVEDEHDEYHALEYWDGGSGRGRTRRM
jgi:hypothetical protein